MNYNNQNFYRFVLDEEFSVEENCGQWKKQKKVLKAFNSIIFIEFNLATSSKHQQQEQSSTHNNFFTCFHFVLHYFINFLCSSFNLFMISLLVFFGLLSSFSFSQHVIFHLFPVQKPRIFISYFSCFSYGNIFCFISFLNFHCNGR